jgi:hypothetical protein
VTKGKKEKEGGGGGCKRRRDIKKYERIIYSQNYLCVGAYITTT